MKIQHYPLIGSALACGALAFAMSGVALAQSGSGGNASSNRYSSASMARADSSGTQVEKVRVTRASNYLGADVIATDGRKVGDVVDYYLDLNSAPHLAYIAIMTGGFLDMGGDTRAVPASAISAQGDNCRINISSTEFWDVPVLPENRQRFLSDPQHRQRISQLFSRSNRTASSDSTESSGANPADRQASTSGSAAGEAGDTNTDDPNRAGAMTGRASSQRGTPQLVSFNSLRNANAYGREDERLGYFADAWISLDGGRIPYVEITPTFTPFRTNYDRRYAVPTNKLAQKREYYGYTLNVTSDELNDAEPVSETEGVRMLEDGEFGDAVLRVTVAQR